MVDFEEVKKAVRNAKIGVISAHSIDDMSYLVGSIIELIRIIEIVHLESDEISIEDLDK